MVAGSGEPLTVDLEHAALVGPCSEQQRADWRSAIVPDATGDEHPGPWTTADVIFTPENSERG